MGIRPPGSPTRGVYIRKGTFTTGPFLNSLVALWAAHGRSATSTSTPIQVGPPLAVATAGHEATQKGAAVVAVVSLPATATSFPESSAALSTAALLLLGAISGNVPRRPAAVAGLLLLATHTPLLLLGAFSGNVPRRPAAVAGLLPRATLATLAPPPAVETVVRVIVGDDEDHAPVAPPPATVGGTPAVPVVFTNLVIVPPPRLPPPPPPRWSESERLPSLGTWNRQAPMR